VPAVHMHTEALAGRGKTCRWMSAAAGALGDRVFATLSYVQNNIVICLMASSAVDLLTLISLTVHNLSGMGNIAASWSS